MCSRLAVGLMAVVAIAALFVASCGSASNPPSRTGLFLSDIHFNPLMNKTLADSLVQAPATQWDSIFTTPTPPACATYMQDTNFALLQSALAAIKKQVPNPDVIFISGDFLVHDFQLLFNAFVTNPTPAAYAAFVAKTEQYLAMKLTETYPNAQILPTLGDWDTASGTTDTYADPNFLASFASSWNAAVNKNGSAPNFQTTFSSGGYYSATFPINPKGRLLGLYTQPWANECTNGCAPDGGNLGPVELQWLTAQLADARSQGQKVWLLGHIPAGIDANTTAGNMADAGSCAAAVTPFWSANYSNQLYALFTEYRDVLAFGIFAHEHYDDFREIKDASGNLILGIKLPPSITPLHNNPAFMQFTYDPSNGVITDTTTWYLNNLASTPNATTATWAQLYTFDSTYGQTAFNAAGISGTIQQITTQTGAQATYTNFYPILYPAGDPSGGLNPFLIWACALDNVTVADYTACYCGN